MDTIYRILPSVELSTSTNKLAKRAPVVYNYLQLFNDKLTKNPRLCYPRVMKKLMLTFLLLALPTAALAESKKQVVVLKKDCYEIGNMHYVRCDLTIKNIGRTDVKNVLISYTSPKKKLTASDTIDYLPAHETMSVKLIWDLYRRTDEDGPAMSLDEAREKAKASTDAYMKMSYDEKLKSMDEDLKLSDEKIRKTAHSLSEKYKDIAVGLLTESITISYQPAN